MEGACSPDECTNRISLLTYDEWQLHQELTLHWVKPPRSWGYQRSLFWKIHLSLFQTSDQLPPELWIILQLCLQPGCHTSPMWSIVIFSPCKCFWAALLKELEPNTLFPIYSEIRKLHQDVNKGEAFFTGKILLWKEKKIIWSKWCA